MDFEAFLVAVTAAAGVTPSVRIVTPEPTPEQFLYLKCGRSGKGHILYVFFPEKLSQAELEFSDDVFPSGQAVDLLTGQEIKLTCAASGRRAVVTAGRFHLAVLANIANDYE